MFVGGLIIITVYQVAIVLLVVYPYEYSLKSEYNTNLMNGPFSAQLALFIFFFVSHKLLFFKCRLCVTFTWMTMEHEQHMYYIVCEKCVSLDTVVTQRKYQALYDTKFYYL